MKSFSSGKWVSLAVILSLSIAACTDDDPAPEAAGTITIEFDNRYGEDKLAPGTEYVNSSGEHFTITTLNYYVSNFILTTVGGHEYIVPQDLSYFLIREDDEASQKITLTGIPAGDYNKITFTVGVDSLRSTMSAAMRTGVLDPSTEAAMYWTPEHGYIFLKLKGTSPVAPATHFSYHIGGFGGIDESAPTINNIKTRTIDMGTAKAIVHEGKSPQVHLHVDVSEFFANPVSIRIADQPNVAFTEYSTVVANNYVNMFKYDHVHN